MPKLFMYCQEPIISNRRAVVGSREILLFHSKENRVDVISQTQANNRSQQLSTAKPRRDPFPSKAETSSSQWPRLGMVLQAPQLPPPIQPTVFSAPLKYPASQTQLVHVPNPPTAPATDPRALNVDNIAAKIVSKVNRAINSQTPNYFL